MLWIAIGAAMVIGFAVLAVVAKRPIDDLGSVSAHWVAQHRNDAP